MPAPTQQQQTNDDLWLYLILVLGAVVGVLTGTAYLATFITSQTGPGVELSEMLAAIFRLPANMSEPAAAFPEPARSRLPGPVGYWAIHGAVLTVASTVVIKVWIWSSRRGQGLDKRRRLDIEAQPRLANHGELKTERITRPTHGRFVYGRDGRHLLATHRHDNTSRHRKVPGALGLIGPSRSGKSLTAITGTQLYPGPAIIASVKTDLIAPTIETRRQLGDVKIYDPSGLTTTASATWSPLHDARSFVEAQRAAGRLLAAVPADRSGSGKFWSQAGESLVGALLWLAANTPDLSMTDVARWVMGLDQPTAEDPGKAAAYLRTLATTEGIDPELVADVTTTLTGVWRSDDRLTGSFYASARQAVKPWTREEVRNVSMTTTIDLDWLTSGDNTLYLAAPLMDQETLAPAFGALVADLVDQVILRHDQHRRPLEHELLLLVDETANMPLAQLPDWTSTVAGYGIQLVTVWQSLSQIETAYGHDAANTIIANHHTLLFFPRIKDPATADYVARTLGTEHQPGFVNHRATLLDTRDRESATGVSLVPAHVLRQMNDEDRLLIAGNLPPAQIKAITKIPERWHEPGTNGES